MKTLKEIAEMPENNNQERELKFYALLSYILHLEECEARAADEMIRLNLAILNEQDLDYDLGYISSDYEPEIVEAITVA